MLLRDHNLRILGLVQLGLPSIQLQLVLIQLFDHDLWLDGRGLRGIARQLVIRLGLWLAWLLWNSGLGLLELLGLLCLAIGNQHGRRAVRLFIIILVKNLLVARRAEQLADNVG